MLVKAIGELGALIAEATAKQEVATNDTELVNIIENLNTEALQRSVAEEVSQPVLQG